MTCESPIRTSAWTPPDDPLVRTSSRASNARFTNSTSSAAGRTARYGVTLRMPRLVVVVAAVAAVVMAALLARSASSRALNDGLGRWFRLWAICTSSVSSGSPAGSGARGSESARSRASASRSLRASSLMDVPHASSQRFERPELKLLHRALGAPERLGDLADALLLDEAGDDDALLIVGQAGDQVGQHRPPVGIRRACRLVRVRGQLAALAGALLPAIGEGVPGDL